MAEAPSVGLTVPLGHVVIDRRTAWCLAVEERGEASAPLGPVRERVVGWSISERIDADIVEDALDMPCCRRRSAAGTTLRPRS